ncbi:uncharacterized protein LOC132314328 [Cornus florida]|uniref:uncharacterized protein LOC132314328 n=1 Tax=Cornus florida TaxID=4283 RepID=UPI002896EFF9|nr:uncharacterized protein LOC132314328 [Cornus florida]
MAEKEERDSQSVRDSKRQSKDTESHSEGPLKKKQCQQPGHYISECPQVQKTCFRCGQSSHLKRDCPQRGGDAHKVTGLQQRPARTTIVQSKQTGHSKSECPQVQKTCFRCGQSSHLKKDCPQQGGDAHRVTGIQQRPAQTTIVQSKQTGHSKSECPQVQKTCFRCGQSSHFKRDCPQKGGDAHRVTGLQQRPAKTNIVQYRQQPGC